MWKVVGTQDECSNVYNREELYKEYVNKMESLCMKEDKIKDLNRTIRMKASLVFKAAFSLN